MARFLRFNQTFVRNRISVWKLGEIDDGIGF